MASRSLWKKLRSVSLSCYMLFYSTLYLNLEIRELLLGAQIEAQEREPFPMWCQTFLEMFKTQSVQDLTKSSAVSATSVLSVKTSAWNSF